MSTTVLTTLLLLLIATHVTQSTVCNTVTPNPSPEILSKHLSATERPSSSPIPNLSTIRTLASTSDTFSIRGLRHRRQATVLCLCRPGIVCPSQCCTKNWYDCSAKSRCCSRGWKCVSWKKRKRCQPPHCVRKWGNCGSRKPPCCNGLRCRRRFWRKRCVRH